MTTKIVHTLEIGLGQLKDVLVWLLKSQSKVMPTDLQQDNYNVLKFYKSYHIIFVCSTKTNRDKSTWIRKDSPGLRTPHQLVQTDKVLHNRTPTTKLYMNLLSPAVSEVTFYLRRVNKRLITCCFYLLTHVCALQPEFVCCQTPNKYRISFLRVIHPGRGRILNNKRLGTAIRK